MAVSADIKGFFHQIYVDENDVHVFQFWWYEDDELTKPCLFEMKVHIFGTKSSPAVATFILRHNAETLLGELSLEVVKAIMEVFYTNNFLSSYPTGNCISTSPQCSSVED